MPSRATGTFEVTLTPTPVGTSTAPTPVSHLSIDKQFRGDLQATSVGQMLAMTTAVAGSAGYVAIEVVTGTLDGHHGSFALQHSGTMSRGAQALSVTVVPDSGTSELEGLAGTMSIEIADGSHSYTFEYTLG